MTSTPPDLQWTKSDTKASPPIWRPWSGDSDKQTNITMSTLVKHQTQPPIWISGLFPPQQDGIPINISPMITTFIIYTAIVRPGCYGEHQVWIMSHTVKLHYPQRTTTCLPPRQLFPLWEQSSGWRMDGCLRIMRFYCVGET